MKDFDMLAAQGVIGLYQSCEVTEIFIMTKGDSKFSNLYTIIAFQDKAKTCHSEKFPGNKIKYNNNTHIGIKQYELTIPEARIRFENLSNGKGWDEKINNIALRRLPKQFVPFTDGTPLNKVLKNNIDNGSYVIEFFDEKKNTYGPILDYNTRQRFDNLCTSIAELIPILLTGLPDRIGSVMFQFPITIVDISSRAIKTWTGTTLSFVWHPSLKAIPNCHISVTETLDSNIIGYTTEDYNKLDAQDFISGSLDGKTHIVVTRASPTLILSTFQGNYIKGINFGMNIVGHETRTFDVDGQIQSVQVKSAERPRQKQAKEFNDLIRARLYNAERRRLESSLQFKQYGRNATTHQEGLADIRKLIERNDQNGAYLWDPFLSSQDLLKTLFYSPTAGVPLRAITALSTVKDNTVPRETLLITRSRYTQELVDSNSNKYGLDLEFRCKIDHHGWAFHDRFLIFPGSDETPAKAYSLGTSVNSFGKEHHILQEVTHPQRIVDAFEELWDKLNNSTCLIWKSR